MRRKGELRRRPRIRFVSSIEAGPGLCGSGSELGAVAKKDLDSEGRGSRTRHEAADASPLAFATSAPPSPRQYTQLHTNSHGDATPGLGKLGGVGRDVLQAERRLLDAVEPLGPVGLHRCWCALGRTAG